MRKLHLLAALAGLSALAAATGPAAADPVRLDEPALGGVAAGGPDLDVSSLTSNTTINSTHTSVSSRDTITQMLDSAAVNDNLSTGISSANVGAFGNAASTVNGAIMSAAPR